jgi:hypothetical protein
MRPKGPTPHVVVELDDLVFDLDCLAEAQVDNTGEILRDFLEVFRDRRVDDSDTPRILSALRKTKVEHRWNNEQSVGMKGVRRLVSPLFELVRSLRSQLQFTRQQMARGVGQG